MVASATSLKISMPKADDVEKKPLVKEVDPIDLDDKGTDTAPVSKEGEDEPKDPQEPLQDVDYKEELRKAQRRIKQADFTIETMKKGKDSVPDIDSIKNVIRETLREERALENTAKMDSLLEGISNADERSLIQFHLENTIKTSGDTVRDFQTARTLANTSKLFEENAELRRAASPKPSSDSMGSPTDKGGPKKDDQDVTKVFTQEQLSRFKFAGIDPKTILAKAKTVEGKHYAQTNLETYKTK